MAHVIINLCVCPCNITNAVLSLSRALGIFVDMAGMAAAYLLKCDDLLRLLLFASLLALSSGVLSVAPDDFSSACDLFVEPYQPKEKMLMDTQYYESTTLLGTQGEDGLWLSIDFDGTTGNFIEKVRKYKC